LRQYKRLVVNTFWFALGNVGSKSIAFLMLPIFTRYLLPSDYGKIELLNTTVSLLTPIITLQLIEAVFRYAVEVRNEKEKASEVISSALFFMIILFIFLAMFSPLIGRFEIIREYGSYFYTIFLTSVVFGVLKQFTRGIDKVKIYVTSDILYSLIFAVSSSIFLIVLKLGIKGYLISNVISQISCIAFLVCAAKLYEYVKLTFNRTLLREMLSYSVPLIPNGIMWWIVTAADRYVLTHYLGYEATGIYSVAARFPSLITVLYSVFFQAWQLSAMEEFGKPDFNGFFRNVFAVLSIFLFFGSSLLVLLIKPFISVYVGGMYAESWRYTVFLILGAVFHIFSSFYGVIYTSSKKTIGAFSTSIVAATVEIVTIFSLVKYLGIQAASLSTFAAYVAMFAARVLHTRRIMKVNIEIKSILGCSIVIFTQCMLVLSLKGVTMYLAQLPLFCVLFLLQKNELVKILAYANSATKRLRRK